MCLIIQGNANDVRAQLLGTPYLLDDVYGANSDGLGVMFSHEGELVVAKTLPKTAEEARVWLTTVLPVDARQVAIHARYATHGTVTDNNVHPYPTDGGYLMHNGILKHTTALSVDGNSDTYHYCRKFLDGAAHAILATPGGASLLGEHIGHNRFVFLDRDGQLHIINRDQGLEHEGVWYANEYAWTPALLIPSYGKAATTYKFSAPTRKQAASAEDLYDWVAGSVDEALDNYSVADLEALFEEDDTREMAIDYILGWYELARYEGVAGAVAGTIGFEAAVQAWVGGERDALDEMARTLPLTLAEALVFGCEWVDWQEPPAEAFEDYDPDYGYAGLPKVQ